MPPTHFLKLWKAECTYVVHLLAPSYAPEGEWVLWAFNQDARALKAEFDKVAAHNEHHLDQIEFALGVRVATR